MPHKSLSTPSTGGIPEPAALTARAERHRHGKALRRKVPREAHADWSVPRRRDPIALLIAAERGRIPELLPLRHGRMAQSPFAYFRGAAAAMAADLATTPTSGLMVQAGGDCHLLNFGAYFSPEGEPVFDINDFDETLPAPFEWDVKRLAASIVLAAQEAGLSSSIGVGIAQKSVRLYRQRMATLATLSPLAAWHVHIDLLQAIGAIENKALRRREEKRLAVAHDLPAQFYRSRGGGGWRIRDDRPTVFHFDAKRSDVHHLAAHRAFALYRESLEEQDRLLLDRYRLADVAFKVVGVGSVGTFCAIGLFMTPDGAPLLLQIKEAMASCLASYTGASVYRNQGQRVVTGQRILQASNDIFLGWTEDRRRHRHFYVRRYKDRALAAIGLDLEAEALSFYAELCGRTLARAHARSGDAAAISGYLGKSAGFDHAITQFASAYATQTESDYRALLAAIKTGRIAATTA